MQEAEPSGEQNTHGVPTTPMAAESTCLAGELLGRRSAPEQSGVIRSGGLVRILGINAVFHDPAAALVVDGVVVAAAEEERFSRRKHGKRPVPFAAWELPVAAARWCLEQAGIRRPSSTPSAYSYDPALVRPAQELGLDDPWDHLRTLFATNGAGFPGRRAARPGPDRVSFVPHHVAHAASAGLAAPVRDVQVLVCDGRGEQASHLAGPLRRRPAAGLAAQRLPHSLGLMYEDAHRPPGLPAVQRRVQGDGARLLRQADDSWTRCGEKVRLTGDGGFVTEPIDWADLAPPRAADEEWSAEHADLAASVQRRLEEVAARTWPPMLHAPHR